MLSSHSVVQLSPTAERYQDNNSQFLYNIPSKISKSISLEHSGKWGEGGRIGWEKH